jgi:hypothetical protein
MDFYESDAGANIVNRFRQEETRDEQLARAVTLVSKIYALEHMPLTIAHDRHKEFAHFWHDTTREIGGDVGDAVEQLGKALGFAYELQSDPAYTIADRLSLQQSIRRRKPQGSVYASESLADMFIRDFTLARLSLKGNVRDPNEARAVFTDTRFKLGGNNATLEQAVRQGLELSPVYFPKPNISRTSH